MLIAALRRLRHGPLKRLNALWLLLGQAWRWSSRRLGGAITVRHRIGRYGPFRLDGFFAFSNFAQWGSNHNEGFAACIEACRGQRCVMDVGAHIGLVTLPMANVIDPGGRVVAFEPSGINRAYLERHIALNGFTDRVSVVAALVGERESEGIPFFELDEAAGQNTTIAGVLPPDTPQSMIAQVTLDRYCAKTGLSPEVIKIDVEGAEIDVLRGARKTLTELRPVVFLSVHPRQIRAAGRSLEELNAVISSVGYDCRHTDGSPVSAFALREYILRPAAISLPLTPRECQAN